MRSLAFLFVLLVSANSVWANDSFVETFNGSGIYSTTSGQLPGLDNPGWSITSGEFRDEGLAFSVVPGTDRVISSTFSRKLSDSCSFKERIELRNYYQGPVDIFGSPPSNYSEVELGHTPTQGGVGISVRITESDLDGANWTIITEGTQLIPSSQTIALEILYDKQQSLKSMTYEYDDADVRKRIVIGPYATSARNSGSSTRFRVVAGGAGEISGIIDNWSYVSLCDSYAALTS